MIVMIVMIVMITGEPFLPPRDATQPVTTRSVRLEVLGEHDVVRPDEVPRQRVRDEEFAAEEVVHAEVEGVLRILVDEDGGDGGVEEQERDGVEDDRGGDDADAGRVVGNHVAVRHHRPSMMMLLLMPLLMRR